MRVVIPSVQYADFLSVTLPAWRQRLPWADVTVVTAPGDQATVDVAAAVGVECFVTDAWTRQVPVQNEKVGPVVFNKAAALDEAFGFVAGPRPAPTRKEFCVSVDADVYPCGPWPDVRRSDTLYGCARYDCPTPEVLEGHVRGEIPLSELPLVAPLGPPGAVMTPGRVAKRCAGYFLLFRYMPGRRFGNWRDAGGYDTAFRGQFDARVGLTSFYVLHLGGRDRRNWRGRVLPTWA